MTETLARAWGMIERGRRRRVAPMDAREAAPSAWSRGRSAAVMVISTLAGCSSVAVPPADIAPVASWTEEGEASWYGDPFHGRLTASGETYDMEGLTAAHRTLPFGTTILVENLRTGEQITLRINDRGPFARGRVLDVSRRAGRELGMMGSGTAPVRVTVVTSPPELDCWEVQAGAFGVAANAERLRADWEGQGYTAQVLPPGADGLYLVRLGPVSSRTEAEGLAARVDGVVLGCARLPT